MTIPDFVVRKHGINVTVHFYENQSKSDIYNYLSNQLDSAKTKGATRYDLCYPKLKR